MLHGNEDDQIRQDNGEKGLNPVHTQSDKRCCKCPGSGVHAHRHPQRQIGSAAP